MSANFLTDNHDIMFHLKKTAQFEEIYKYLSQDEKELLGAESAEEYKKGWIDALEIIGDIAGGQIAASRQAIDKAGFKIKDGKEICAPELKQNVKTLVEVGVGAQGIDPAYGGMGAPYTVEMAGCEILNRACPSTMLSVGWFSNIALIINKFGSEELKSKYIPQLAEGTISGNMALTEPDAGSDLGALKTYAEKQDDGLYHLTGTKRFITNGIGEISLVLARSKKSLTGLKCLSLYLVPKVFEGKENIKLTKIEEKVGLKGSATCELVYEASRGYLLGKEGKGFTYMLQLMNDSRIAVGFQGVGLMEATYQLAHSYAHERCAWGKPIAHHELISEKLLDMETELKGIRSLCYRAATLRAHAEVLDRYLKREKKLPAQKRRELTEKQRGYEQGLRDLTPLVKYWVGEKSVVHARTAVQILGGYGFSTEYAAEYWVRESLIYSLYEGTSQIQALMTLKDTIKNLMKNPRKFIEDGFYYRIKSFSETCPLQKKIYKMRREGHKAIITILLKVLKNNAKISLSNSDRDILKAIKILRKKLLSLDDISFALLNAERLCEIKCAVEIAETLYKDSELDPSRRYLAERYIHTQLPLVSYLKEQIELDEPVMAERMQQSKTFLAKKTQVAS